MAPKNSKVTRFERPTTVEHQFYGDIIRNQQTDIAGDLADTVLVCEGGSLRIHSFLLQAASPFFQKAIFSQGENYPFTREILLPDFHVQDIKLMLDLIYKGYAEVEHQKDVASLKETLEFFEVTNINYKGKAEGDPIKGTLKVQESRKIPKNLKLDVKMDAGDSDTPTPAVAVVISRKSLNGGNQQEPAGALRRSGRPAKPVLKPTVTEAEGEDDQDSDYKGEGSSEEEQDETEEEEDDSEFENDSPRKRRKATATTAKKQHQQRQPVVRLPRIATQPQSAGNPSPSPSPAKPSSVTQSPAAAAEKPKPKSKKKKDDSKVDTEDENWVEPDFEDKEWFERESRRCQSCNKLYDRPAEASLCITKHKSLRCYFCFKVFSTTDKLFAHFTRRHKQAGRDSTLVCPYCEQAVPYKSVSCHVISVHLRNSSSADENSGRIRGAISPSKKTGGVKSSAGPKSKTAEAATPTPTKRPRPGPASMKRKLNSSSDGATKKGGNKSGPARNQENEEVVKVPDLDITLEKVTRLGNTLIFRLQKQRPAVA